MVPIRLIGVIAAGFGLAFLLKPKKEKSREKDLLPATHTEKEVTPEEIKRVMSHFGKRSGEVRNKN